MLSLVLLLPGAWLLRRLLGAVGHDELLPLLGVVLALVPGYALFDAVGLKGDLGALVLGMLLAGHRRAPEYDGDLRSATRAGATVGFQLYDGAGAELADRAVQAAGLDGPSAP